MKENGIAPAVNFSPGIDYRWKIIPLPSSDNHQSRDYVVAKILTLGSAISLVLLQAARAGLSEEPLFRGFLWGYLKKLGWTEGKILFFQAGLFAVAHVELLLLAMVMPFLFTLIAGLMLGWLAMRSRSISTSVMAYGFANGVGQMVSDYRIFEVLHLYR